MNPNELIAAASRLLGLSALTWNEATVEVAVLVPDGSSRRFYQLRGPDRAACIAILPPDNDECGQAEAVAFFRIGSHLHRSGAPTPALYAFDPATGLALCEDLGSRRLYEQVMHKGVAQAQPLYEQAVRQLAGMQVRAAEGFDPSWCWDTPRYDRQLMQERESGYFLRACCTDLLGIEFDRPTVEAECARVAEEAAQAPAHFFLHRDFQSRNIMLTGEQVRFIDFQGGRLGPLAYDLASLLLDPYAALSQAMQEHLLGIYLDALNEHIAYDNRQFRREYVFLAVQRNLQILGAFAFLSQVRQKPFFAQFLRPALASLGTLLAKPEMAEYAALNHLATQCRQELAQRS